MSNVVPHDVSTGALLAPTVSCHVALVRVVEVDGCKRQKTTPGGSSRAGA
jgi:hypothetical protein